LRKKNGVSVTGRKMNRAIVIKSKRKPC